MALDPELDHDIHQQIEELLDVSARQLLAATALLDQQHQLLEGQFGARGTIYLVLLVMAALAFAGASVAVLMIE